MLIRGARTLAYYASCWQGAKLIIYLHFVASTGMYISFLGHEPTPYHAIVAKIYKLGLANIQGVTKIPLYA